MTVHVVLNDASLETGAGPADDVTLVEQLARSFLALLDSVAVYDEGNLLACVPDSCFWSTLPAGSKLSDALRALQRRSPLMASRLRNILTRGPRFDSRGTVLSLTPPRDAEVTCKNVSPETPVPALRVAWVLSGLSWSANRPGWWQRSKVPVRVTEVGGEPRDEEITNIWAEAIDAAHRAALQGRIAVVPAYENPRHHDPDWPEYKGHKSEIPRNAKRLLRHAVSEESGTTFWAKCIHNFYHRFQGSGAAKDGSLLVHWNATTNKRAKGNDPIKGKPTTDNDVPWEVRKQLERLIIVEDCGCREI